LVENVLASTTGIASGRLGSAVLTTQPQVSWLERVQAWALGVGEPVWGTIRQPRFAMSFGMAFFALSVGLTVLGVKPANVREISLRPTALRHSYNMTQARVVRYYENIRFVYEMESRVREFKRSVTPAEPGPRRRKNIRTTLARSPNRNRSAITARRKTIWFSPALRTLPLSNFSKATICL
jgi:hypothetical protein